MMQDPVLFWNAVVLELNRRDHSQADGTPDQGGPTLSSRATAMAHIAIHDAHVLVNAGVFDPYIPLALRPTLPAGIADPVQFAAVAVGSATCAVLLHLYPSFHAYIVGEFDTFCSEWGADGAAHDFGRAVGDAVVALRRTDGANPDPDQVRASYAASHGAGRHRPDPVNPNQGFAGPGYGRTPLFAVTAFHVLNPPPPIGDAAYLADFDEVRANGALQGTSRTPDETIQGLFWAYDGAKGLGTPPRLYNQVIRTIVQGFDDNGAPLSTDELARLFLLANLAMGDAGILAWYSKYDYDVWRPVVGIREHDPSMGLGATTPSSGLDARCDPMWLPLGAPRTNEPEKGPFTPPFPAYPSGHATFAAAAFHTVRLFLESIGRANIAADGSDDLAFDFTSEELDGKSVGQGGVVRAAHTRHFDGLHAAIYENSVSRVFLGVHWRFDGTSESSALDAVTAVDKIGGVPLGMAIAADIAGQPMVASSAAVPPPAP